MKRFGSISFFFLNTMRSFYNFQYSFSLNSRMMTLAQNRKTAKEVNQFAFFFFSQVFFLGCVTIKSQGKRLQRQFFSYFQALFVAGSLKPQKYNLSSFMPEVSEKKNKIYVCTLEQSPHINNYEYEPASRPRRRCFSAFEHIHIFIL